MHSHDVERDGEQLTFSWKCNIRIRLQVMDGACAEMPLVEHGEGGA